jgi:hypothetical protein
MRPDIDPRLAGLTIGAVLRGQPAGDNFLVRLGAAYGVLLCKTLNGARAVMLSVK